jgi:oligoendopeptidase F
VRPPDVGSLLGIWAAFLSRSSREGKEIVETGVFGHTEQMHRNFIRHGVIAALLVAALGAGTLAQERDRSKIPDQFKWDLTALYPSDEAWRQARDRVAAQIPLVRQFEGKLGESASRLLEALDVVSGIAKDLGRVSIYAGLLADQDTRASGPQAMRQEVTRLAATFSAEVAFAEPEILKMNRDTISRFVAEKPGLKVYAHYLDDIVRRQPHTGTESEEKLIAEAGLMFPAPS